MRSPGLGIPAEHTGMVAIREYALIASAQQMGHRGCDNPFVDIGLGVLT